MTAIESTLLLNMIPDIGPVRHRNLIEHFGDAASVFSASVNGLKSIEGISDLLARRILKMRQERPLAEKEIKLAQTHRIHILTLDHPAYPDSIKSLSDPPPVLYCNGDLQCLSAASVAIIGTRHPTPYGERVAATLSRELSELGIHTVSGLARGIDTIAHRSTLQAKGKTIAVLGSGLLRIYPPENVRLSELIWEKGGAVVSEFPLRFPPESGHFPRRNRIISGLSMGTVVVEAAEKSGALITAKYAAEQGKEVFAVPGPVTSKMSRGPHILIKQGAKLVENCAEILEEIAPAGQRKLPKLFHESHPLLNDPMLTEQEKQLLHIIHVEPVHIDLLSSKSRLGSGDLSQALLNLEMKGAVKSLPGKMYVRN